MATSPDAVRSDLLVITAAAQQELREVAASAAEDPAALRSALFAATPLLISDYAEASAALALDWFEEIRFESGVSAPFRPRPVVPVADDDVAAIVARTTEPLHEILQGIEREYQEALAASLSALEAEVQKEVAAGFRETVTENAKADPAAAGWKRHAQPDACKFCRMLAAKGAVYTEATARFAAHTDCSCIAGPEFGGQEIWAEATPMQYLASQRQRTDAERKKLREYLNRKYPDAPG